MRTRFLIGCFCGVLILAAGCGKGKSNDESIAKKTGRKVAENISDFAKGVDKGLTSVGKVKVAVSAEVKKLGLRQTIAQKLAKDEPGISVYMISSGKTYALLCAKAFNKDGQEIGRSSAKVDFEADDAKYVKFVFPGEMDFSLVAAYDIDVVK